MTVQEKVLAWLLRISGVALLTAFGAVFLPVAWMALTHRWLGLGEFPAAPLVDYLTRSISVLYGIYGGLVLLISFDLRRYRPVVAYVAWMGVVAGILLLGIDIHAGMPRYWTQAEGPMLVVMAAVILVLLRSVPHQREGG